MARTRRPPADAAQTGADPGAGRIWRIGVYIRLSREDGSGRDESESVVNQKKIIAEYLERQFEDRYAVVDFYVDDGLTGTDDAREQFARLASDIESGAVDCIICKTLARAFRNYADQGYYLEYRFPRRGARFISIADPHVDTFKNPEAMTGLEVPISGIMNDRYAARTSSDVRRTFAKKRRDGDFIGAFAPYGYLKDPENKNRLVLDERIAPLKRDMRNWLVRESMSLAGVARRLNALGIPNPTAYKRQLGLNYHNPHAAENDGLWSPVSVRRILLDKVNLGHVVQGKQRVVSYKVHDAVAVPESEWECVENMHQPTFTQREYDELADVLRRDTRTPNQSGVLHLFSGFLRCAGCGRALQRRPAKGRVYYACRTRAEKPKAACAGHSIRLDLLEAAVLASLQAQIALVDDLDALLDRVSARPARARPDGIASLLDARRRELARLEDAADSLYVDWKANEIAAQDYRRMRAKFDARIARLRAAICGIERERQTTGDAAPQNQRLDAFLRRRNIEKLERGALVALVDAIHIHADKRITIKLKFADPYPRGPDFYCR